MVLASATSPLILLHAAIFLLINLGSGNMALYLQFLRGTLKQGEFVEGELKSE
jgi:hypothetical protein